jgi:hypothetical protein
MKRMTYLAVLCLVVLALAASALPILTRQGFPLYPNSFEQDIAQLADFITTISPINRTTG